MKRHQSGFTIVELIVSIAVIAILASVVIFGFSSWRTSVAKTEMKNELINAASAIKMYRNTAGAYPAALSNASYTSSANVSLVYTLRGGSVSYCLNAGSTVVTTATHYYIDSAVSLNPTTTACS